MSQVTGTHILLDGKNAGINFSTIKMEVIEQYLYDIISNTGISILWKIFHDFKEPTWAFTGIFLLGESHFSIHTFPEDRYITVDLYTCNMTRNYTEESMSVINKIIDYFEIQEPIIRTLQR